MCERVRVGEGQVKQTYWNAKQPTSLFQEVHALSLLRLLALVLSHSALTFCFSPERMRKKARTPCYYCPPTLAVNVKSIWKFAYCSASP